MTQNNQSQKKITLEDRAVEIDPIGLVFNVTNEQIEDFVGDYLSSVKHIEGVEAVRMILRNEGNIPAGTAPSIDFFVFVSLNSKHVSTNLNNVPTQLRNMMDVGQVNLRDEFFHAVKPIAKFNRDRKIDATAVVRDNIAVIRLDLFRTLSLMFAATTKSNYQISLMDARRIGKERSALMVAKVESLVDRPSYSGGDRFAKIASAMEDRD